MLLHLFFEVGFFWGVGGVGVVCAVFVRQNLMFFCGTTILKTKVVFCDYKQLESVKSFSLQAVRKRNLVENMELFATISSSV